MKNLLLAGAAAIGLSGSASANESVKILELKPNCSAILNQEINGKIFDIITCPNPGSFDSNSHIVPSTTITNGALTQYIGEMQFPELAVNEEVQIPLEGLPGITFGKSQDENGEYYYSSTPGYTQLQKSQGFDCYKGTDYITGSQLMMCSDIGKINENYEKIGFTESGTIIFPDGVIDFYDGGGMGMILKNNVPL